LFEAIGADGDCASGDADRTDDLLPMSWSGARPGTTLGAGSGYTSVRSTMLGTKPAYRPMMVVDTITAARAL
jgi:hypothetical protein